MTTTATPVARHTAGPPVGVDAAQAPGVTGARSALPSATVPSVPTGHAAWRGPGQVRRALGRLAAVGDRNLAGPVAVIMCSGLLVQAWAVGRSRAGDTAGGTQALFWLGMALIFLAPTARIVGRFASRGERVLLAVALPGALQLSRVVLYPTTFAFHDEFIHANDLRLMQDTHHLFAFNSLLPVSSYYPGMEIATDALTQLTGLSAHACAVVVLLFARVVLALAVLSLVARLSGSVRAGCIASLIYTCNPQAIFFNSQYSYQTFALPIAAFTLYAFVARDRGERTLRSLTLPAAGLLVVAASHHLTSMLLVAASSAWLVLDALIVRRGSSDDRRALAAMFCFGIVVVVGWAAIPGNPVLGYLRTIGTSSVGDIRARLSGQDTHQLFHSSGGLTSPLWERVATIASILLVFLAVLPTIWLMRRWLHGKQVPLVLMGIVALLYPIIPLGHITPGTGEVTDRASGFLFLGVGLAVALGPMFRVRPHVRHLGPLFTAALFVVFVGSEILGAGPTVAQLPGKFLVSADARSIDAANLAAAQWERAHLPAGSRVYADRDAGLLAAAVGGQYTVTHVADNIDASRILLAPTFTRADRNLIRAARIRYVIVDLRDSTNLPNEQVYIESGEYGSENRTKPVSARALHKLASVPGVQRIYSNGPLVIYDVGALDAR